MNLASRLMDFVFPDRVAEKEMIRQALNRNSQATDDLTILVKEASYRPDQTMRLRVGEWAEKK